MNCSVRANVVILREKKTINIFNGERMVENGREILVEKEIQSKARSAKIKKSHLLPPISITKIFETKKKQQIDHGMVFLLF